MRIKRTRIHIMKGTKSTCAVERTNWRFVYSRSVAVLVKLAHLLKPSHVPESAPNSVQLLHKPGTLACVLYHEALSFASACSARLRRARWSLEASSPYIFSGRLLPMYLLDLLSSFLVNTFWDLKPFGANRWPATKLHSRDFFHLASFLSTQHQYFKSCAE